MISAQFACAKVFFALKILSAAVLFADEPIALFALCACCKISCDKNADNAEDKTIIKTNHINNCVRPTAAMPIIFHTISWKGLTELIITSAIRFIFSSITPRITAAPYINNVI